MTLVFIFLIVFPLLFGLAEVFSGRLSDDGQDVDLVED
jgi:hypothetical protein